MRAPVNAWYAAAWSHEIGRTPLVRTLLGEPIVFYRNLGGIAVGLSDRCPHRFAPLHQGVLKGDAICCPYHGLEFGSDGRCVHNPHGEAIPPNARVKNFPLFERQGILWIWPGDPDRADPANLPEFPEVSEGTTRRTIRGYLRMRANYLLIIDNLLDLTHSGYLHVNSISVPASLRPPESTSGVDVSGIFSRFLTREVPASGQFREIWGEAPCDYHRESRWTAPSLIYTIIGCAPVGKPLSEGIYGDGRHLLTPETDLTTHYFYTATRYANLEPAHDAEILKLVEQAFLYEDEPMIAACQAYMGSHDLFDLDPIILPTDRASVLARRTIARMMTDELNPKLSEPEPV